MKAQAQIAVAYGLDTASKPNRLYVTIDGVMARELDGWHESKASAMGITHRSTYGNSRGFCMTATRNDAKPGWMGIRSPSKSFLGNQATRGTTRRRTPGPTEAMRGARNCSVLFESHRGATCFKRDRSGNRRSAGVWPPRLGGASVQAQRLAIFDRARDCPRGAWVPKARALRD